MKEVKVRIRIYTEAHVTRFGFLSTMNSVPTTGFRVLYDKACFFYILSHLFAFLSYF
jgi:hypothetical protein